MAPRRLLPSQAYLQECFTYDPDTGVLTWKERPLSHFRDGKVYSAERLWLTRNGRCAGKKAGCIAITPTGYKRTQVSLDGRNEIASRVVYKIIYGVDPVEVDHADLDSTNNSRINLRESELDGNRQNRKNLRNNTSGFKGVTKTPRGKYQARISYKDKCRNLGVFDTPEKAYAAYCSAALKLHGEFARLK